MDSLTQVVLGAAVGVAVAPKLGRRAVVYGALLGTLPDLDTLLMGGADPLRQFVEHRSYSHSLIVLSLLAPVLALLLWQVDRGLRVVGRLRWCIAAWLVLVTHPLLDAFTVYGTQLLWPLPFWPPVMWGTVFIIDPLYTLPLLVAALCAWRRAARPSRAQAVVLVGLLLSSAYLGWSVLAKHWAEQRALVALQAEGLPATRLLVSPAPFTTLMWRAVAIGPNGDGEAWISLRPGAPPVQWQWTDTDPALRSAALVLPAGQRLHWFSHGFLRATQDGTRLRVADLRMGGDGQYFFHFAIAEHDGGGWTPITPERLPRPPVRLEQLGGIYARF